MRTVCSLTVLRCFQEVFHKAMELLREAWPPGWSGPAPVLKVKSARKGHSAGKHPVGCCLQGWRSVFTIGVSPHWHPQQVRCPWPMRAHGACILLSSNCWGGDQKDEGTGGKRNIMEAALWWDKESSSDSWQVCRQADRVVFACWMYVL